MDRRYRGKILSRIGHEVSTRSAWRFRVKISRLFVVVAFLVNFAAGQKFLIRALFPVPPRLWR
jgi:hypothetical protein